MMMSREVELSRVERVIGGHCMFHAAPSERCSIKKRHGYTNQRKRK